MTASCHTQPHIVAAAKILRARHSCRPQGFNGNFENWGGWGSNPRPVDYEKHGLVHRTHHLHGYHGAVPPMALIALFAPMARSTNRSTHSIVITGWRYRTLLPTARLDAMGPARRK
jgi:hypothetical protein